MSDEQIREAVQLIERFSPKPGDLLVIRASWSMAVMRRIREQLRDILAVDPETGRKVGILMLPADAPADRVSLFESNVLTRVKNIWRECICDLLDGTDLPCPKCLQDESEGG